jgi:hypothetical protein
MKKKSERYDVNMAHDVARIVYESIREQLERQGAAKDIPHYEELSKKYNGNKQLEQYLDDLHKVNVKRNEKAKPQV